MQNYIKICVTSLCIAVLIPFGAAAAADQNAQWEAQVRKADEIYWQAFNFGTAAELNSHVTADVEFYHDLGGWLKGIEAMTKANAGMESNQTRLRRTPVPGTVRIYPMREGPKIYGAVVMGDHTFHRTDSGKLAKYAGKASFSHLMLLKDGKWKFSRIYSYGHEWEK